MKDPTPSTPATPREFWIQPPTDPLSSMKGSVLPYEPMGQGFIHVREVLARPQEAYPGPDVMAAQVLRKCGIGLYYFEENGRRIYMKNLTEVDAPQPPAVEQVSANAIEWLKWCVKFPLAHSYCGAETYAAEILAALSQSKRPMTDKEEKVLQAAKRWLNAGPLMLGNTAELLAIAVAELEVAASRTSEPEQP